MMKRLNRSWSDSAAGIISPSTNGKAIPARCEQREDDYYEFDQHESDPCSSRHVQPEPLQLKVRLRRMALSCGNTLTSLLCLLIPQLHALAPVPASCSTCEKTLCERLMRSIAYARYETHESEQGMKMRDSTLINVLCRQC